MLHLKILDCNKRSNSLDVKNLIIEIQYIINHIIFTNFIIKQFKYDKVVFLSLQ